MTRSRRLADLEDPGDVGRRAAERAARRLGARRVATCEVPVIFDPVTAPSLLGHVVACVNGGAVSRGPGGAPSAAPTNLWLEPGKQTLEE